jgi:hypothetical protein
LVRMLNSLVQEMWDSIEMTQDSIHQIQLGFISRISQNQL